MPKLSKLIFLFSILLSLAFAEDGDDHEDSIRPTPTSTTLPVTISCGSNPCQSAFAEKWFTNPAYVNSFCSYYLSSPPERHIGENFARNNPAVACTPGIPPLRAQASISSVCSCYSGHFPTKPTPKTSDLSCPPDNTVTETAAASTITTTATATTTSIVTNGATCPSASVRTLTSTSVSIRSVTPTCPTSNCPSNTYTPPIITSIEKCTKSRAATTVTITQSLTSIRTITSVLTIVVDPLPPSRITVTEPCASTRVVDTKCRNDVRTVTQTSVVTLVIDPLPFTVTVTQTQRVGGNFTVGIRGK